MATIMCTFTVQPWLLTFLWI